MFEQFFKVRDAAEAKKKCKRRLKRTAGKKSEDTDKEEEGSAFSPQLLVLSDVVETLPSHTIRCTARVRSFAFDPSYRSISTGATSGTSTGSSAGRECRGLVSLINNSLEIYQIPYADSAGDEAPAAPAKLSVIDIHGHK